MKKLLASLILCLGLIPCFSSAGLELKYTHTAQAGNDKSYTCTQGNFLCARIGYCPSFDFNFDHGNQANSMGSRSSNPVPNQLGVCSNNTTIYYTTSSDCTLYLDCYEITEYTTLQCQTEYNLIPISEVDANYCESNNLCSSGGGSPSDCPNVGVSNVFINDVFHPGAFNVIINIPEEIDWDYAYTNSGNNINIDVVGYNQDTEYINAWIDTNNYKPTSDDFTNTFLLFKDYSGLLIALLFVILVFYFVKKLF